MNKNKNSRRIKMFGALIIAYMVVSFGSPNVFMANSPKLKPEFISSIRSAPQTAYALARHPFNADARNSAVESAQLGSRDDKSDLPYQLIAPGVYAAEDPETNERFIKVEGGTTIEVRYITLSDGRKVKVYVPISQ